jgi:hypothetical protein
MTFTENSGLVRIWVRRVESGKATLDDVPKIYNLAEVVKSIIEGKA